jgi:hypothetical protein
MSRTENMLLRLREALAPTDADVASSHEDCIEVSDRSAQSGRRIEIRIRGDSAMDVAFHVPEKRGSPFEQTFAGPAATAEDIQSEVVQFVVDLVTERQVLVMHSGAFRSGRRFIAPSRVTSDLRKWLLWVTSWRGSFDDNEVTSFTSGRGNHQPE